MYSKSTPIMGKTTRRTISNESLTTPQRKISTASSPSFMQSRSPSLHSTSSLSKSTLRTTSGSRGSVSSSSLSNPSTPTTSSSRSKSETFVHPQHIYLKSKHTTSSVRTNEPYRGTITVTARIKPVLELNPRDKQIWHKTRSNTISNDELGDFQFDHIFSETSQNFEVYKTTTVPLIERLFDGFNVTLFAYGMTGSGKTYTMMGNNISGQMTDDGIVPLSVSLLYSEIFNGKPGKKFDVLVSYLEIYNEKVFDLLDNGNTGNNLPFMSPSPAKFNGSSNELKIRDDTKYGVRVVGLTEKRVENSNDLLKWIKMGDLNRKTGQTDFNVRSSRSHAIILIRLITTDLIDGCTISNTLSLCDLAGSERCTGQSERRKEGAFINKSLLALGTVISKLSEESINNNDTNHGGNDKRVTSNSSHIPYRDSKLTRLLQPALSGNGIITTICTVDPRSEASTETLNTLRFGSRAKNVSLNVQKRSNYGNKLDDEKTRILLNSMKIQIEEQNQIIEELRLEKSKNMNSLEATNNNNPNISLLKAENSVLKGKLSNVENLLDRDSVVVQDSEILEIVEMLPIEVGTLLEAKILNMEFQTRQYKKYTNDLENKLMGLESNSLSSQLIPTSDSDSKLKDMEIARLEKMLERKDKMIEALQTVKSLHDRALRPVLNSIENENHFERNDHIKDCF